MSRRRQLLDSIATRIATATGITSVHPWKSDSFTAGHLPAIAWRDRSARSTGYVIGADYQTLTVAYAGYAFGSTVGIRETLVQILGAVGQDTTQGGLAISTSYISSRIGIEVGGETVCGCQLIVEILYRIIGEDLSSRRLLDENENILTDENGDHLTW